MNLTLEERRGGDMTTKSLPGLKHTVVHNLISQTGSQTTLGHWALVLLPVGNREFQIPYVRTQVYQNTFSPDAIGNAIKNCQNTSLDIFKQEVTQIRLS